jgi:hypothetical protein
MLYKVPDFGPNRESRENRERSRRCNPPYRKSTSVTVSTTHGHCSDCQDGKAVGAGGESQKTCLVRSPRRCGDSTHRVEKQGVGWQLTCHRPMPVEGAENGCSLQNRQVLKAVLFWRFAGPFLKCGITCHQPDAISTSMVEMPSTHERRFRCRKFIVHRTQALQMHRIT